MSIGVNCATHVFLWHRKCITKLGNDSEQSDCNEPVLAVKSLGCGRNYTEIITARQFKRARTKGKIMSKRFVATVVAGLLTMLASRAEAQVNVPAGAKAATNPVQNPGVTGGQNNAVNNQQGLQGRNGNIDSAVVQWAAAALQSRISLSQLAAQQAATPQVRQFAQQVLQQESQLLQLLQTGGGLSGTAGGNNGLNPNGVNSQSGLGTAGGTPNATLGGGLQNGAAGLNNGAAAAGQTPAAVTGGGIGKVPAGAAAIAGAAAANPGALLPTVQAKGTLNAQPGGNQNAGLRGQSMTPQGKGVGGTGVANGNALGGAAGVGGVGTGTAGGGEMIGLVQELIGQGANFDMTFLGIQLVQDIDLMATANVFAQLASPNVGQVLQQLTQLNQQELQTALNLLRQLGAAAGNGGPGQAIPNNNPSDQ